MEREASRTGKQPRIKVYACGDFKIEQRDEETGHYREVPYTRLAQRSSALKMLKVLLCQPHRRISRNALLTALWPQQGQATKSNIAHIFDTAISQLRRHILDVPSGHTLLCTQHQNGTTMFALPGQDDFWIDADALLELAQKADQQEQQGEDAQTTLLQAYEIVQGEFLEDDLQSGWSQLRRQTIAGTHRRILYRLIERYLQEHKQGQAEALLFHHLEEFPTDQDALCRLLTLLNVEQRKYEALHILQYCTAIITDQQQQPHHDLCELANQLEKTCRLHESSAFYHVHRRNYSSSGQRRGHEYGQRAIASA